MYRSSLIACLALTSLMPALQAELPTEAAAIEKYLSQRGCNLSRDSSGHPIKLVSQGKPPLLPEEYQLIGQLTSLEEIGLNAAPLADDQWGFLRQLPKLRRLMVWHGHQFASLEAFSNLPLEELTIGGCLGLREKNRQQPDRLRDAVMTLHDLPHLRRLVLYHSPLTVDDQHLAAIAQRFPKLDELRLDFAAPPGQASSVTAAGLANLQPLPLARLHLENVGYFTTDHYQALVKLSGLKQLILDGRKQPVTNERLQGLRQARPDLEIQVVAADQPLPAKRP
jgi:hypothetical protein